MCIRDSLNIEYDGQVSIPTNSLNIIDSIVHIGDTNTKIRFPAADTFTVETAGSERLRIDSSGRVLIGHQSSQQSTSMLQVSRANNSIIRVACSDATATNFAAVDFAPANSIAGARIAAVAVGTFGSSGAETAYLKFETRNAGTTSEKLRITGGGQVQIPTNGQQLTWGASQQFKMYWENSEDRMYLQGDGAYGMAFRINGGNRLEINKTTGDVTMQGASGRNFNWDNSDASLYLTDNGGSSARLKIGTGGDLQLYHDTTGNYNHISCANNGHLKLSANSTQFYDYTGVTQYLRVQSGDDRVRVYGEAAVDGTSGGADGLSIAVNGGASCPLYFGTETHSCLLYTSPSPRDRTRSRMPSSA